jgi:hypothetical protein
MKQATRRRRHTTPDIVQTDFHGRGKGIELVAGCHGAVRPLFANLRRRAVCPLLAAYYLIGLPISDIQHENPRGVGRGRLLTRSCRSRTADWEKMTRGPSGLTWVARMDPVFQARSAGSALG